MTQVRTVNLHYSADGLLRLPGDVYECSIENAAQLHEAGHVDLTESAHKQEEERAAE